VICQLYRSWLKSARPKRTRPEQTEGTGPVAPSRHDRARSSAGQHATGPLLLAPSPSARQQRPPYSRPYRASPADCDLSLVPDVIPKISGATRRVAAFSSSFADHLRRPAVNSHLARSSLRSMHCLCASSGNGRSPDRTFSHNAFHFLTNCSYRRSKSDEVQVGRCGHIRQLRRKRLAGFWGHPRVCADHRGDIWRPRLRAGSASVPQVRTSPLGWPRQRSLSSSAPRPPLQA
jgi:hypothetical protein